MKRIIALFLSAALLTVMAAAALAEVPQISGGMFSAAKSALTCLASGEYERLVTLLPFSGEAPSASEWKRFAEGNFSGLSGAQTEYAVAWWNGSAWKLAVPVSEPDHDVDVLVLTSSDGAVFDGYGYATWSRVQSGYSSADYVVWDREYIGGSPTVKKDG